MHPRILEEESKNSDLEMHFGRELKCLSLNAGPCASLEQCIKGTQNASKLVHNHSPSAAVMETKAAKYAATCAPSLSYDTKAKRRQLTGSQLISSVHSQQLPAYSTMMLAPSGASVPSTRSMSIANLQPSAQTIQIENGPEALLASGVLHKRGSFIKTWAAGYFVLSDTHLRYYKLKKGCVRSTFAVHSFFGENVEHCSLNREKGDHSGCMPKISQHRLRGEISREDFMHVEALDDSCKPRRPYCFTITIRKRSKGKASQTQRESLKQTENIRIKSRHSCAHSIMESSLNLIEKKKRRHSCRMTQGNYGKTPLESFKVLYLQSGSEQDRQKWVQAIQRWIKSRSFNSAGEVFGSVEEISGQEILCALVEVKAIRSIEPKCLLGRSQQSPIATQAARRIEDEFPVVASLLRDMMDCSHPEEMVFILDQLLGEVKEGWAASIMYMKKLVAAAGGSKLESCPEVWTNPVKSAYARIMKVLASTQIALIAKGGSFTSGLTPPMMHRALSNCSQHLSSPSANQLHTRPFRDHLHSLEEEQSFHRYYRVGRKLGSGSFSVVYTATHRETNKQMAVKCISKLELGEADVEALRQEVEIMATLNHPNLVPLLDYFDESRYYYILTPLCTGGELFDDLVKRKSYTEEDARCLMKKLACAIVYVHSRGIVHRDLKPENILLKTSAPGAEVMIADFGFARFLKGEDGSRRTGTACGTPGYVAPEVVCGRPYGAEVDCWSLGVILYILLCGYAPFPGKNHAAVLEKVARGDYKFESPDWDHISSEAKDLVSQLINVDPTKRLTACEMLQHPWMNRPEMVALTSPEKVKTRLRQMQADLSPALTHMRKHHQAMEKPEVPIIPTIRHSSFVKDLDTSIEYYDSEVELDEALILESRNGDEDEDDFYAAVEDVSVLDFQDERRKVKVRD